MKIALNTYNLACQKPGGGEMVIFKTKEYLEKKGHQVELFNKWIHKVDDFDIWHEFSLLEWREWVYYKNSGIPFVLTPTSWMRSDTLSKTREKISSTVKNLTKKTNLPVTVRESLALPDLILPTTSIEMERLFEYYNLDRNISKASILANGIDLPNESVNADLFKNKFNLSNYFLCVGNISPNKNFDKAITIAKSLGHPIVIIGDRVQTFSDYYDSIIKHQSDDVVFAGRIENNNELLASAYKGATATLIPSDFETCSLVGLESSSYGTPIIITEEGGTKEIFPQNTSFINPSSEVEMKEAMEQAIEGKLESESLKKHVIDNYTWDRIIEKLLGYYDMVIAEKKRVK